MAKASDNEYPSVLFVEQASNPATPASGRARIFRKTDNKWYGIDDAGTATELGGGSSVFTAYADYTPAITAVTTNPTLGTGGSITGRYMQVGTGAGSHVEGTVYALFGTSGTNAGSGAYRFSVPSSLNIKAPGPGYSIGYGYLYDSSSGAVRTVALAYISATTFQALVDNNAGAAGNSIPWAWAASDSMQLHFAYEVA